MNISEREKLETIYFRKSPHTEKTIILGKKHSGMDEVISPQGMEAMMNETFKDVDLFKNNISLFTNKFVSPLSSIGPSFYKILFGGYSGFGGRFLRDIVFCSC